MVQEGWGYILTSFCPWERGANSASERKEKGASAPFSPILGFYLENLGTSRTRLELQSLKTLLGGGGAALVPTSRSSHGQVRT